MTTRVGFGNGLQKIWLAIFVETIVDWWSLIFLNPCGFNRALYILVRMLISFEKKKFVLPELFSFLWTHSYVEIILPITRIKHHIDDGVKRGEWYTYYSSSHLSKKWTQNHCGLLGWSDILLISDNVNRFDVW